MQEINDPQYRTDDGSALRIWTDTAKNNFQSDAEGRAVFDEVVYVEVIAPGSGGSAPVFEVIRKLSTGGEMKGTQYEQFAKYITDYLSTETSDGAMAGTPLKEWPEISRTMAASLKSAQIFTVDALAELPDTALTLVGPDGRTWREKAKAFLLASKDASIATRQAGEIAQLRADLAASEARVAELAAKIGDVNAAADAAVGALGTDAPVPDPLASVVDPLTAASADTVAAAGAKSSKAAKDAPII